MWNQLMSLNHLNLKSIEISHFSPTGLLSLETSATASCGRYVIWFSIFILFFDAGWDTMNIFRQMLFGLGSAAWDAAQAIRWSSKGPGIDMFDVFFALCCFCSCKKGKAVEWFPIVCFLVLIKKVNGFGQANFLQKVLRHCFAGQRTCGTSNSCCPESHHVASKPQSWSTLMQGAT